MLPSTISKYPPLSSLCLTKPVLFYIPCVQRASLLVILSFTSLFLGAVGSQERRPSGCSGTRWRTRRRRQRRRPRTWLQLLLSHRSPNSTSDRIAYEDLDRWYELMAHGNAFLVISTWMEVLFCRCGYCFFFFSQLLSASFSILSFVFHLSAVMKSQVPECVCETLYLHGNF